MSSVEENEPQSAGRPGMTLRERIAALAGGFPALQRSPRSLARRIFVLQLAWAVVVYLLVSVALTSR